MSNKTLEYKIAVDTSSSTSNVKKLTGAVKQFERSIKKSSKSSKRLGDDVANAFKFKGISTSVSAVTGLFSAALAGSLAVASSFVRINSEAELLRARMATVTGGVDQGNKAFQRMLDLSTELPFSIDAIVDSFAKFTAAGLKDAEGYVINLSDAISAFGGDSTNFKLATVAIQQMVGKGVISMEEMRRQLAEQIPTAFNIMAKQAGMSIGELMDTISKGKASADEFLPYLNKGFKETYGGTSLRMMDTFKGAMTRVGNQWKKLMIDIGDSKGSFSSLKGVVQSAAEALEKFRTSAEGKKVIDEMGESLKKAFDVLSDPEAMERFFNSMAKKIKSSLVLLKPLADFFVNMGGDTDNLSGWFDTMDLKFEGVNVGNIKGSDAYKYREQLLEIRELKKSMSPLLIFKILGIDEVTVDSVAARARIKELAEEINAASNKSIGIKVDSSELDESKAKIPEWKQAWNDANSQAIDGLSGYLTTVGNAMKESSEKVAELKDKILSLSETLRELSDNLQKDLISVDLEMAVTDAEKYSIKIKELNRLKIESSKIDTTDPTQLAKFKDNIDRQKELIKSLSYVSNQTTKEQTKFALDQYNRATANYANYRSVANKQALDSAKRNLAETVRLNSSANEKMSRNSYVEKKKEMLKEVYKEEAKITEAELDNAKVKLTEIEKINKEQEELHEYIAEKLKEASDKQISMTKAWVSELKYVEDAYDRILKKSSSIGTADIPGRASGGSVTRNTQYMVGERGPELFVPNNSGTIVPNNKLKSEGRKTIDINLSFGGQSTVVQGTKQTVRDIQRMFSRNNRLASA